MCTMSKYNIKRSSKSISFSPIQAIFKILFFFKNCMDANNFSWICDFCGELLFGICDCEEGVFIIQFCEN
jgi:hypothetical protein